MSRKASKTHDDCRSLLCFGCAKSSCSKRLGPSDKSLVELFFDQAFNWSDPKYPLGICGPCQKALKATNFSNPESVTKLTDSWKSMPWLSDEHFAVPSSPLRSSGKCPCKICEAAKSQAPTKGFKHFKKSNPFGSKESKAGHPPKAASGLLCKDCLAEVKAGEEHKCSAANRRSSLLKLAEADPQGSQMIAARVVKDLPGSPGKGTKRLVQAHGGKPLPVLPGGSAPVRSNSKKVSARNVLAIQARTDLSARKRRQVVSDVNRYHKMGSVSGRKVFRSNVESDISEMKRIFSTHFETTEVIINGEKTILAHVKSSDQFEKYLLKCKGIDHGNILTSQECSDAHIEFMRGGGRCGESRTFISETLRLQKWPKTPFLLILAQNVDQTFAEHTAQSDRMHHFSEGYPEFLCGVHLPITRVAS